MSSLIVFGFVLMGLVFTSLQGFGDEVPSDVQCTMITFVTPVLPANQSVLTKENINHYVVASSLTPTTDPNHFMSQMQTGVEQKILDDFMRSETFKKSTVGKTANQVEKMSQTSVTVNKKDKIDFQVKLVERQVVVTYQGAVKSEIIYTMDQGTVKWVLSRPLDKSTSIAFTNTASLSGSNASSILSLNHSF